MKRPGSYGPAGLLDSDFRELAKARLDFAPPSVAAQLAGPSDYDLNPGMRETLVGTRALRAAAVLIGVQFGSETTILLTKRTAQLAKHAGQISFPGGKIDPDDSDARAAALREIREELGIDREYIEPLGFLDCYETRTGFLVAPLVAILKPGFTIVPDPGEVDQHFEVPLAFLMEPGNRLTEAREFDGVTRYYYAMPYETRYIWGATAGILVNMHERLFAR